MIKKIFLFQAALEAIAGVTLVLRPDLLLFNPDAGSHALAISKLYGISAFTIGSISFLIYKDFAFSTFCRKITLIFVAFHLLVALHMYSVYQHQITPHPGAFATHFAISVLLLLAYLKEKNRFIENDVMNSDNQIQNIDL